MTKIRLIDFIKEMENDIKEFNIYWNKKHKKFPETYPILLDPGDWDEQFNFWQSNGKPLEEDFIYMP